MLSTYGPLGKLCLLVLSCAADWKITLSQKSEMYSLMYDWMDFMIETKGVSIQHKMNMGKEKKVGPYPVDGFDQKRNTISFMVVTGTDISAGSPRVVNDKWHKCRKQKYEKTLETTRYLEFRGFTVIEVWECQFRNQIRSSSRLRDFIHDRSPETPQRPVSESEILAGVQSGHMFGMV